MVILTIGMIYLLGLLISMTMLKVEQESEGDPITKADIAIRKGLSMLSWLMVIICLVRGWFYATDKNGYWKKPIKETEIIEEKKTTKVK